MNYDETGTTDLDGDLQPVWDPILRTDFYSRRDRLMEWGKVTVAGAFVAAAAAGIWSMLQADAGPMEIVVFGIACCVVQLFLVTWLWTR